MELQAGKRLEVEVEVEEEEEAALEPQVVGGNVPTLEAQRIQMNQASKH